MRPVRLVAQAFGPFAERVEIDFRPALAQRLFGIYGPTGAGKTSVLDAMAFALFGVSSGGERTRAHLRSDLADIDVRTYVEFLFELGDRRYFVRREPEQELRSARKDSRVFPATAAVFDATGLDPDAIGPDNPGRALAERRLKDVDEVLCNLLGYDAEQFRQVVMLPQGRFRDLLTAGSDQRSTILRGLFDVSVFERFAERLKSRAAGLEADVLNARREIETRLADLGAASAEAVQAMIDQRRTALATAEAERTELDARRTAAEAAWAAGQALAERFTEAATADAALVQLQGQAPVTAAKRLRLEQAQAARELVPLQTAASRAATEASRLASEVANLAHALEGARRAAEEAEAAAAASRLEAPRRAALQEAREAAARRLDRVKAAAPLQTALADAERQFTEAETNAAMAGVAVEQARRGLDGAEQNLAAARQRSERAGGLALSLEKLRHASAAAQAYEVQQALAATRRATLSEAEAKLAKADAVARDLDARLAELHSRTQAAHAVQLASELRDGAPCPVCGALKHPAPARGALAGEDPADLRAAEAAAGLGRDALGRAQTAAAEARALAADVAAALAGQTVPEQPAAVLAAQVTAAEAELADLQSAPGTPAAEAARGAAVEALQSAEAQHRSTQADAAALASALEGRRAALATELATVPHELRTPEAAQAALDAAAGAEAAAVAAHQAAEAHAASTTQALAVESATLEARRGEAGRADATAQAAAAELAAAIAARGLTPELYAAAAADIGQIEALIAELAAHQDALAAAVDRQARAARAVEGAAAPDLEALAAAKAAADTALTTRLEQTANQAAELQGWTAAQARIAESRQRQAEAEAAFATVGELSRLAQGRNPLRMSLVDYAVAAYFEDVLEAANIRFRRMSQGRFELRRKTVAQDGRSRAGLEILVYDAHSGRERDAQTLSGGEGFMAALALALGLSDVVQAESGGVKLDAIFIDEGFGHLDEQSLDRALDTLRDLVGEARAVGVISHVDLVKAQIPAGFDVTPNVRGSRVAARAF